MTAPAHAAGYVDDGSLFSDMLGTALRTVPALDWPSSVGTYTQMAPDPQLAAVLKSYILPISRADWALDPMGSRPDVYGLVADDLGLPVKGEERSPSGARVRGVRWGQHLRQALAVLTYGHMPFEIETPRVGNRFRLAGLYERMPSTLAEITPTRQGELESITQWPATAQDKPRPIPAEHLQFYVHDRHGSAWHGTSLLRPAYGPWYLKREMWRILGVSSQRFGTGILNMRALPGTTPTPSQITAAASIATRVRVGNQAGMASPPGFTPELIGLSGSTPDTLGFVKYLDQQMSRMALAGFMDLGQTDNGSRALGESFIDLMLLAIQDIADAIADQVTTQTVARLVEWNFGEDEAVPAVVCADVGARHEVTAEALAALITSGALSWDPALEQYVRVAWKLPDRDPDSPPPVPRSAVTLAARAARARAR